MAKDIDIRQGDVLTAIRSKPEGQIEIQDGVFISPWQYAIDNNMRFTLGRLLRNPLVPKFFQVKESGEDVSYTPFAYANKFQPEMAAFLNSLTLKALFDVSRRDRCYITIETAPRVYKSPWDVTQEFVDRFVAQNSCINQVFKAKHPKSFDSDSRTLTPLIFSCEFNPKMAKELIAGGADVNLSSGYTTPLRSAIERGDSELVKLLIAHKADVSSNISGEPPLDFAVIWERLQLIPILLEHQAKGSSNIVCLALYQTDMLLDAAKDNKELLDCALKDSVKTLNVAKILILHVKYGFDTKSTYTALNESIIIYHKLNNVEKNRLGYSDIKEVMELASEILILMANSPKMTGEVVAKTADYSTSFKEPTTFTKILQEHPCWSIYKKQADGSDNPLLTYLSQETQDLNKANLQRSVDLKKWIKEFDQTPEKDYPISKALFYHIIDYNLPPDSLDLAAANYFEDHPDELPVVQLLAEDASGAASAAAHEG